MRFRTEQLSIEIQTQGATPAWEDAIASSIAEKLDDAEEIFALSKSVAGHDADTVKHCISSFFEYYALKALKEECPEAFDAYAQEKFSFVIFVEDDVQR